MLWKKDKMTGIVVMMAKIVYNYTSLIFFKKRLLISKILYFILFVLICFLVEFGLNSNYCRLNVLTHQNVSDHSDVDDQLVGSRTWSSKRYTRLILCFSKTRLMMRKLTNLWQMFLKNEFNRKNNHSIETKQCILE